MTILAFGDLHLGSIKSDYEGIQEILMRFKRKSKEQRKYVFLGDLIDSTNMYSVQKYYQFPESVNIQRVLVIWLNSLLEGEKILVCGNHEKNPNMNNILELLKLLGWKIYEHYYCEDVEIGYPELSPYPNEKKRICFAHTSFKTYRGSNVIGKTPGLQYFDYILGKNLGADIMVTAHIHKVLNITVVDGIKFITLPAFEYDINSPSKVLAHTPSCWVIFEKENKERIEFVRRTVDDILNLRERNIRFISRIIDEYYPAIHSLIYSKQ